MCCQSSIVIEAFSVNRTDLRQVGLCVEDASHAQSIAGRLGQGLGLSLSSGGNFRQRHHSADKVGGCAVPDSEGIQQGLFPSTGLMRVCGCTCSSD